MEAKSLQLLIKCHTKKFLSLKLAARREALHDNPNTMAANETRATGG